MSLTAEQLVRSLTDRDVRLLGPPDTEIYGVKPWLGSETTQPGILYIAPYHQVTYTQGNILLTNESDAASILLDLQNSLFRDYQADSAMIQLTQAILEKAPLDKIARICYKIMDNAVFFFNEQFTMTASYKTEEMKVFLPSILSREDIGTKSHTVVLSSNERCPCNCLLGPIYHNGNLTGYLLVVAWEILDNENTKNYFETMRGILSNRLNLDDSTMQLSEKQQFILELLKQSVPNTKAIEERKQALRFPVYDKYYILSIQMDNRRLSSFMGSTLQSILNTEIYEYNHYYIAIIGCSLKERITEDTYPKLLSLLEQHELYAGLSNGFLDFSSIKPAFEQSTLAISMRIRVSGTTVRFCRYEDQILSHLIDMAHQRGMHYELFCHPNVVYIERYDREHGTDYLKTLTTYVFNGTQLALTANKLFIHRNTLYHRINVLKEDFGIDFENPREVMKLRISCTAYGFFGKVENVAELFGPLN